MLVLFLLNSLVFKVKQTTLFTQSCYNNCLLQYMTLCTKQWKKNILRTLHNTHKSTWELNSSVGCKSLNFTVKTIHLKSVKKTAVEVLYCHAKSTQLRDPTPLFRGCYDKQFFAFFSVCVFNFCLEIHFKIKNINNTEKPLAGVWVP